VERCIHTRSPTSRWLSCRALSRRRRHSRRGSLRHQGWLPHRTACGWPIRCSRRASRISASSRTRALGEPADQREGERARH
jgi:hypothetical protein